jgi:hypothetical protein
MKEKYIFDKDTAKYAVKKKPDMYRLSTRFLFFPRKIQGKIYWLRSVPILEIKNTYKYSDTEIYFSWDILEWYEP